MDGDLQHQVLIVTYLYRRITFFVIVHLRYMPKELFRSAEVIDENVSVSPYMEHGGSHCSIVDIRIGFCLAPLCA